MPDKTSRAIKRLLSRPGLHSVRFFRRGSEVHVEGYSNDIVKVPQGVIVPDGGERTLVDAVDCLAAQAWDRGEPPDQLAEADAHAGRDPYNASPEQLHTGLIRDREKAERETDAYLERAIAAEGRAEKAETRVAELEGRPELRTMADAPTDGDVVMMVAEARWDGGTSAWWRGRTIGWLSLSNQRGECTGVAASWCPRCGDCTCEDDNVTCSLHGLSSKHAEPDQGGEGESNG